MIITNAVAYDDTATVTSVKSLIVHGPVVLTIKLFTAVIFSISQ
jgi:hypothetical protein